MNRTICCTLALAVLPLLLSACAEPNTHDESQHDEGRTQRLEPSSTASFAQSTPFVQVGLLLDTDATDVEVRVADGRWRPVEITWSEGVHKVGRVLLDEPATQIELRANSPWSFGTIEFYDEVLAGEVLTRDLPLATAGTSPSALTPAGLVVSRAAWGARDPNKVCGSAHTPYRMAIHHTASPDSDGGDAPARMRQMQAYHIDSNGWCDIGYHFVVSQGGQLYQGRSDEQRTGAHVGNQNTGNIGVSLIGNFEVQQVSRVQFDKTAEIVGWIGRTYDIPFTRGAIKGHREHDGQSTSCPGANMLSRLDELIAQADSGVQVPVMPAAVAFEVNVLDGPTDLYQAGSSAGKPDFFPGDSLRAEIKFTNTTTAPLRNVSLGYWFEAPHLAATSYVIESDAPGLDGVTFATNDANDNPDNPARDALGAEGALGVYAMAAGESKRIVVDLEAGDYSIGLVDHPDVRGWVRHIDDRYGEQGAFDEDPATNTFEALLQGFAQLDVLSRQEWQFDAGEPDQVEGWSGCPGVSPVVDIERGALTAEVGPADCLDAPPWTLIDTERWDQIVLRMTVEGGHQSAIYWAAEGEEFSAERAVSFVTDEATQTYLLPVGDHPNWAGQVARLRITPSLTETTPAAIDAVFVQSSSGEVGSAREQLVTAPPVEMDQNVDGAPVPGTDGPTTEMPHDVDDIRVNRGCATAAGHPSNLLWILAFVFATRRRRT